MTKLCVKFVCEIILCETWCVSVWRREAGGGGGGGEGTWDTESKTRTPHKIVGKTHF